MQWRWAVGAGAQHNIGAPVAVATGGWARVWNTSTVAVAQRPPDGAVTISALVTDMAGNVLTITTPAVVDNTAPDVKAVLTAPPAVAGSPTLIWTPAHDAVGITRYEVLRGGNVIATVASIAGAQTFSYSDKSAPDQATSTYIVRAWDGAAHSVDSNAVPVLVDSTAVTAAKGLTAPTPTSAAPVLTWSAPSSFAVNHYDVYRDGLLVGSTPGAGATFTDATATEGTHDYAVLARDAASKPGVLSASFKVVFDRTAPTSGGAPTAQVLASGQVNLVWPAAGDALSGVAGYVVRRTGGGVAPAAADGGTAVCAPAQPGCSDASAATGTWSYGVFARDAAGNVALIGTVSNVVVVDKTPPLAPTKLTVTRPKGKSKSKSITLTLHWVKPTAADLDRMVVVLNLKRAPVGPADGKAVYHGLGTSAKVKLLPGQVGYFAVYAYDHSGNYSHSPLRKKVSLASLISLRPLSGSPVSVSTPGAHLEGREGQHLLQRAGLPQWQARGRRLAQQGLLPHPAGHAQVGHVRLVRVAGRPAREQLADLRQADRPRDVHLHEEVARNGGWPYRVVRALPLPRLRRRGRPRPHAARERPRTPGRARCRGLRALLRRT